MIDGQLISISLFSGAFGLDLGLEQAGFYTASVVEIDPDCTKTIALNRPHLSESAVPRDVRDVTAPMLLEEGCRALGINRSLQPGEIDLVTGGPPCQSFSTVGKRGSILDPRGSLFMDFVRLVRGIQPRFFMMENVRGLLSAPIRHRPHSQRGHSYPPLELDEMQGAALAVVLAELESLGYEISHALVEAADYGVPQNRQRVIFVGSKGVHRFKFPLPTHSKNPNKSLQKWRTLKDALQNLVDDQPEFVPYSKNRLKYLRLLKAGQNWRYLPDELKQEAMGGAYKSGGGKVGFYRRLSWDKPSPTITTCPHQKATDMCHPEELRPLSVKECAKIQTFPDDWFFYGSVTSKYRQIGNAVPVELAKALGGQLSKLLKEESVAGREEAYQLSIFTLPQLTKVVTSRSPERNQQARKSFMSDKAILNNLFKDAGIKRSALLAENIRTLERYLEIEEEDLKNIQWVDKKGKYEQMIKDREITQLITKRDLYLKGVEIEDRRAKIESVSIWLAHLPVLKEILKCFVAPRQATKIANYLETIEEVRVDAAKFSKAIENLTFWERDNLISFFSQREEWSSALLQKLPMRVKTLSNILLLRAKFHHKTISIASEEVCLEFQHYLLKNWFSLQTNPHLLLKDEATTSFRNQAGDIESLQILASLLELDTKKLDLLVLFLDEILKMTKSIPNLAKEAILTGNPFLFRSLFLDFKEAEEFAVGGKLNSSLETKYGNLFEKLMGEFENCRGVYDGGVDVVTRGEAFDIKSGPKIMNKSMVDAFSAKQALIQDEGILPDISTYRIALGYGEKEQLNEFMAKIESEILTGRESWTKITGMEHSPELIFAIAGLVPRIFNVKSLVGSVLGESEQYEKDSPDVSEFERLFKNSFSPIDLTPESQAEISTINSLLA